jgi:hypothetical protein
LSLLSLNTDDDQDEDRDEDKIDKDRDEDRDKDVRTASSHPIIFVPIFVPIFVVPYHHRLDPPLSLARAVFKLATLGPVPRQVLAGRRCPPLHAVPRPQEVRRRRLVPP